MSKHILFFLAVVGFSITVPAADLPSLPVDSRIQKGTLGCGVAYYMVTNTSEKGYADIAVVRREEALSSEARNSLNLPFLSRMGVAPRADGYVSENDGSTVFRYERVPFYRPEALDSTLLYAFSQVAASRAEQAVIVCGDIDPAELKKKMDIFSMLVPRTLVKAAHAPDYVWEPSPAPCVTVRPSCGKTSAQVTVAYSSARIRPELMNTAQALVTNIFGREFRTVLSHRLERNLSEAGIPVADVRISAVRSCDTGGDERYSLTVVTDQESIDEAMRIIASTLGELDAFGVSASEFGDVRRINEADYMRKMASGVSMREDTDRCIAHFLYGANLAPLEEEYKLFSRKNVGEDVRAGRMNQFASALLEQLSNLSLEYEAHTDSLDTSDALFYYNLQYLFGSVGPSGTDYSWHYADTLGLAADKSRVRIKAEKTEPVTGGKLWTFSNGMRVAYKNIPGSGMFDYVLALNGGLARVEGLKEGEGGYFGDILSMYGAGGLSSYGFRDLLSSAGIKFEPDVTAGTLEISGDAPSESFSLLMKALVALSSDRQFSVRAFQDYSRNSVFAEEELEELALMSIAPGYAALTSRSPEALTMETCDKAEKYFEERFSRMNDGILVIAGDLDEGVVKKLLSRTLGGFRTGRGTLPRASMDLGNIAGTKRISVSGEPGKLYVLMDASYAVTSLSVSTLEIAAEALKNRLNAHMGPYGYTVRVDSDFIVQPQERVRVGISCSPVSRDGLPEDVVPDPERALSALRAAIKEASVKTVAASDLKAWKTWLRAQTDSNLASPRGTAGSLVQRYVYGKDLGSRYAESISGVTAEDVQALLNALVSGGRVEISTDE